MPGEPTPTRPLDDVELAVTAERKLWENAIFEAARQAGSDRRDLSAGQVLINMADEIVRLRELYE